MSELTTAPGSLVTSPMLAPLGIDASGFHAVCRKRTETALRVYKDVMSQCKAWRDYGYGGYEQDDILRELAKRLTTLAGELKSLADLSQEVLQDERAQKIWLSHADACQKLAARVIKKDNYAHYLSLPANAEIQIIPIASELEQTLDLLPLPVKPIRTPSSARPLLLAGACGGVVVEILQIVFHHL